VQQTDDGVVHRRETFVIKDCMRLPVSTNVADYAKKDLQAAFTNATVTTSVLLELISNRKTVLGAYHADNEKLGMTEDQLTAFLGCSFALGRLGGGCL